MMRPVELLPFASVGVASVVESAARMSDSLVDGAGLGVAPSVTSALGLVLTGSAPGAAAFNFRTGAGCSDSAPPLGSSIQRETSPSL